MNRDTRTPVGNADNSEAIDQVLQAEHAAQQAVAQCQRQAQAIVQAAQMQVQRINQRADQRITRVQMRCAQWLSEQSRQLVSRANAEQIDAAANPPDRDLAALVEALAAQLSGADKAAS